MKRESWVLMGAGLLAVAGMFWLYQQTSGRSGVLLQLGQDQGNRLEVQAAIQSLDLQRGEMSLRLDFVAHDQSLLSQDGVLKKELHLQINNADNNDVVFKKGQRLNAIETTISLYDGQTSNYPFDRHVADLELSVMLVEASNPENVVYPPLRLELSNTVQDLNIQAKQDPESQTEDGYAAIQFTIARNATTTVWAFFVMALMWAMTLAVVSVTRSFATGQRKLEFGAFTWMGSMLFAFVGFRSAAPGVPPIGALIDVLAFFWAELIVALCLVTTVALYLRRNPAGN